MSDQTKYIDFNGHQVKDVHEGIFAVINHYTNPIIGQVQLDTRDGLPYNAERTHEAQRKAADDIYREMTKHVAAEHDRVWVEGYLRGKADHCDYSPSAEYCDIEAASPWSAKAEGAGS